jgi:hypothetical protein
VKIEGFLFKYSDAEMEDDGFSNTYDTIEHFIEAHEGGYFDPVEIAYGIIQIGVLYKKKLYKDQEEVDKVIAEEKASKASEAKKSKVAAK